MDSISSRESGAVRRRLYRMVKEGLRDLGGQLSLLNHTSARASN